MNQIISKEQEKAQLETISYFKENIDFLIKKSDIEIKDDTTYREAVSLKKQITSFISDTDKKRKATTKPIRDAIQAFYDTVNESVNPLTDKKEEITQKILEWENYLEEERQKEIKRITNIKKGFLMAISKIPNTEEQCLESLDKTKEFFNNLDKKDQENPEILEACNLLTSSLREKIENIKQEEIRKQEAERLAKIKKKQDLEALELEKKRIAQEQAKREQEEEKQRLAQEKIDLEIQKKKVEAHKREQAEKNIQPKTGIKTYTKFEIVDSNKVPREYCEPSEKLINEAKKAGVVSIPGVKFYQIQK